MLLRHIINDSDVVSFGNCRPNALLTKIRIEFSTLRLSLIKFIKEHQQFHLTFGLS